MTMADDTTFRAAIAAAHQLEKHPRPQLLQELTDVLCAGIDDRLACVEGALVDERWREVTALTRIIRAAGPGPGLDSARSWCAQLAMAADQVLLLTTGAHRDREASSRRPVADPLPGGQGRPTP